MKRATSHPGPTPIRHRPRRNQTTSSPPKASKGPGLTSPTNQLHHPLLLALVNRTTNNDLPLHVSNLTAKE
ncbi:hypothetical protein PGT21_027581 [Puccinia graminis f. sp. tritici]|uniref:Uncharacterized protein n=1 Tax=Puccinia graminis f. sp. tritici TaxID=56615 RepID=A0A5B0N6X3_PUCGR|nr:hypothetical protein PGT21_027581 [Puccinia graminis f. sp. tritici]